ncbi:AI-2E family transporter [Secundilactobacillus similis]|uniref:AI-2E family transporter n=1 Tax=Secundilactobacillus similis TaxID=414682 RepID=UPI000AF1CFC9|nr:AI-2E family transporter [Secundilactobacillus similis]
MSISKRQVVKYSVVFAIFLVCVIYPQQVFGAIGNLFNVVMPLILGAAMAYCVNLLCRQLEKWFWPHTKQKWLAGLRRPIVLVVSIILILLIISGVLRLVIPQFVDAISGFFKALPSTINDVNQWLTKFDQSTAITKKLASSQFDWTSIQSKVMKYLQVGASGVFSSTVSIFSGLTKGLMNFILAFIFSIYLIMGKEKIGRTLDRLMLAFLPEKFVTKTHYVLRETNQVFSSFIAGQVLEGFILGTLCMLGMLLFRFPDAVSVGALMGVTALIPMIGAWIGGTVGFVLIAVTSPIKAVFFIVYILILQQVEGNLIYPRVVGTSIGLQES